MKYCPRTFDRTHQGKANSFGWGIDGGDVHPWRKMLAFCSHLEYPEYPTRIACVAGGIVVPGAEPPRDASGVSNLYVAPPLKTYSTRLISPASYTGYPIWRLSLHSCTLLPRQMLFLKQCAKRDNAPVQGLARILAWLLEKSVCSHLSSSSNVLRHHAQASSVNPA